MALIQIYSPKGGTGTTTIAANLALLLAGLGRDVTAIDFARQGSLKLHFGVKPDQKLNIAGKHGSEAQVVGGVRLLAHDPLDGDEPANAIAGLCGGEQLVIADIAAGDSATFTALLPHASLHLCPLMADAASLAVLPQITGGKPLTTALPAQNSFFILNQVDERRRLARDTTRFMGATIGDRLIGSIRRDEAVSEALAMMEPIAKYAPTSAAAADIVRVVDTISHLVSIGRGSARADSANSAAA